MSILDSKDSSLKEEEEQQKNDQEFDFVSRKIPINEGELEKYILAILKKAEENVQKTEKKWLNIGFAGFGLFSIFEILKYFFF